MKVVFLCPGETNVEDLVLALSLRWPDSKPLIARCPEVVIQLIEQEEPALVFLCEDSPSSTLWTTVRGIRRVSEVPLIVAARSDVDIDVLKAIELGVDDYITLPCNPMIVMAHVVALLRRAGLSRHAEDEDPIEFGDLVIHPRSYEVFMRSRRLVLTPTEFRLLLLLARSSNMTVTQEVIQREVWAEGIDAGDTLKKHIQRLRRKLGDDAGNPTWIQTVRGVGYRFGVPVPTTV